MSSRAATMPLPSVDPREFRRACGKYATGVTIVTTTGADGAPHGMTANSFTSVSLEPPLVLVCVDQRAKILQHFRASQHFGINVLNEHQQALAHRFAQSGFDRFDSVPWYSSQTGVPLLPGALACLECASGRMIEAGDHVLMLGEVLSATHREGQPLIYFNSGYRKL